MRSIAPWIIGLILMAAGVGLWSPSPVSADGGPHVSGQSVTTDSCAGCHRAHTAQAADLLKAAAPTLCISCHDGTGATTVVNNGESSTGGALKAGGFVSAKIKADDPAPGTIGVLTSTDTHSTTVTSSHSTDGAAQQLWGNGAAGSGAGPAGFTLTCTSCHDPHGNGNYRILRPAPASYTGAFTDRATAVNVPDEATPHVYTTTNYFDNGPLVGTLGPDYGKGWLSLWCTQCHTRYLAPSNSETTSSGDSVFTYRHNTGTASGPSCVKCHAAHGTNSQFTGGSGPGGSNYAAQISWPGSTGTPYEDTALLKMDNRGLCQKCHYR